MYINCTTRETLHAKQLICETSDIHIDQSSFWLIVIALVLLTRSIVHLYQHVRKPQISAQEIPLLRRYTARTERNEDESA